VLVLARPDQQPKIAKALAKIDVMPRQVLVEATIVEITLSGELKYGLQWYLTHHGRNNAAVLDTTIDNSTTAGLYKMFPGFSYSVLDGAGQVRAILNALASESKLHVLSSPSVMVLDNQTANILVGDQVPIVTQQQQSTLTTSPEIINSVQYRDTGVQLSVTPRVNAGGMVTLEISQEVSDVIKTTTSGIDSPTIRQRKILSTVAVRSGQTVALGGLMRHNESTNESGIPVLHKLPVVGALFGGKDISSERTELLVMLTPRVVRDPEELARVTEELRNKLTELKIPTPSK
jgi:general secretion pathway protein D